ncbi:hypothetical protein FF011L_53110 [Roseimaritima multifibrata]|uniref:Uncharacterized protein n=1 Tax=Roseimaritima multifibrata TaxID=1930274 RepID=A0A517MNP0_9BACT|nr:hypothetical protein [Roseimaritima multifibrata]QDS96499.1 hypothetical protein FF011L_53110 [Roseimaritima multifibrata]
MNQHRVLINQDRRKFLRASAWGAAATTVAGMGMSRLAVAETSEPARLPTRPAGVKVLMPQDRVPLSFIIDDSTCLVNMGHFCTPQFATAFPGRAEYQKPWKSWPREIPDNFVRQFGEWCSDHGVKGKYSIVPNPACVGWMDRELPGWSHADLQSSLKLVRELMLPNWDIHPEMITHTRVIDLKTGRPMEKINAATMENSYPQEKKSVDELAAYLAYALRILKNCDLPCEGITTPGGFGNSMKSELPIAVDQAVRDVYGVELPHYFKYVHFGDESTEPKLEHLRGVGTEDVRLTVNVPAGTGDWFGGWQGDSLSEPDRYCNATATSGRMVELIERRQPAVMLCHWPGMYSNGSEEGFRSFQRVVESLASRFADDTIWMKVSEIARYWAAKQLTEISRAGNRLTLNAPFATERYTLQIEGGAGPVCIQQGSERMMLREAPQRSSLDAGTWIADEQKLVACFDLPKGTSEVLLEATS